VSGFVYLIGAGPGDPTLITVRGRDVLGRCDVVLYDALAHPALLDFCRPDAERRYVGKRGGETSATQRDINQELVDLAAKGLTVGRLKGGDPLLFARGAEEALALADAGIPFEIVPGISSPVAVAAYAGIPLTHRDYASSVLFLTGTAHPGLGPDGHDWKRLATRAGTICVLMGMHRLEEIAATLIQEGRPASTAVAIIEWGCRPQQRTVVGTLADIGERARSQNLGSPAVIIIGKVVGLRERLAWVERKPLFGKRIVLTRAADQSKELGDDLRELGADVLPFPTISIQPPRDPAPLREALTHLERFDYLALTSPNGVAKTFEMLDELGLDARVLAKIKIAVIGPGTERALAKRYLRADLVAPEFRGEGLAAAVLDDWGKSSSAAKIGSFEGAGPRVLLPRARVARDALPRILRDAGGVCEVVEAYETCAPDPSRIDDLRARLEEGTIDALTVTSSSTVEHLVRALGNDAARLLAKTRVVSIGPITTETAKKLGVAVARTADEYCLAGLIQALVAELSVSG
jgi:uroporphyrinogen III methyltransferase / synthase